MIRISIILLSFILFLSYINKSVAADDIKSTSQNQLNIEDGNVAKHDFVYSLNNAREVFFNYHKDPVNFENSIDILDGVLSNEPDNVDAMIFLSRVWLTFGHYIEDNTTEKWERFRNGSKIAQQAIKLSAYNADAYFYYVANEASLAKSKGAFGSIFLISKIKKGLNKTLELNPNHAEAIAMKGAILYTIPALMGGDIKESERLIREALVMEPHITSTKIFLAKNLYKQKHYEEAKRVLSEILNEENPKVEADWYLNKRVAIKMIKNINDIEHKQS